LRRKKEKGPQCEGGGGNPAGLGHRGGMNRGLAGKRGSGKEQETSVIKKKSLRSIGALTMQRKGENSRQSILGERKTATQPNFGGGLGERKRRLIVSKSARRATQATKGGPSLMSGETNFK